VHKVSLERILGVVSANKAEDDAFNTACWMSRGWRDVEVEVHLLLEGTRDNLVASDG
jgi:hypothetical protein